ncbi:Threonine efflux protein [Rhodovulum sp. P5]|uniref:LysE family translocator n=1 Tax=Rhodovulum sp. P5 TaxID=1564506 RepID=UPI0009C1D1DE|nr:LysE family translocator [Rhodovulum sp. P5]ARE40285.1 Threonine efflux protein [Rhodovulum sp. P5]
MFDYSLAHWLAFGTAAVLLNLSPGPDLAFILGKVAQGGRRAGFAAMFGIWTGATVHVALAAAGLSVLIASSQVGFSIVKWVGAAYLVWLGVQAFRAQGSGLRVTDLPKVSLWKTFRDGALVNIMNPKMAVFMMAFLPQFVVPGAGPVAAQLALHGVLIIAAAAVIEPLAIVLGDAAMGRVRRSRRAAIWMERALGGLFIALGVRLASEKL